MRNEWFAKRSVTMPHDRIIAVGLLTARIPGLLNARVGDRVHLRWSAHDAHLFDRASGDRLPGV